LQTQFSFSMAELDANIIVPVVMISVFATQLLNVATKDVFEKFWEKSLTEQVGIIIGYFIISLIAVIFLTAGVLFALKIFGFG